MRHLGWLSGLLLVISCSVNPVHNPDGSAPGSGGQAGATPAGGGGQAGRTVTGRGGQAGTTATGSGGQAGTSVATGGTGGTGGSSAGRDGSAGHDGSAGRGGGGSAGHPADAGQSCAQIETEYGKALPEAFECTPGATGQCQHLVNTSLSCPGCKRYVNDVTELDALATMWNDQDCGASPHGICPAIACVVPGPATCAADSGGTPGGPNAGAGPGGTCTPVGVTNNSR